LAVVAPISAACIAAEMLSFVGIHLYKGFAKARGPMLYWLGVAVFAAVIVYGRLVLP
jgi:hypothetical protein